MLISAVVLILVASSVFVASQPSSWNFGNVLNNPKIQKVRTLNYTDKVDVQAKLICQKFKNSDHPIFSKGGHPSCNKNPNKQGNRPPILPRGLAKKHDKLPTFADGKPMVQKSETGTYRIG